MSEKLNTSQCEKVQQQDHPKKCETNKQLPWKSKTNQRMAFWMIYAKDCLLVSYGKCNLWTSWKLHVRHDSTCTSEKFSWNRSIATCHPAVAREQALEKFALTRPFGQQCFPQSSKQALEKHVQKRLDGLPGKC